MFCMILRRIIIAAMVAASGVRGQRMPMKFPRKVSIRAIMGMIRGILFGGLYASRIPSETVSR